MWEIFMGQSESKRKSPEKSQGQSGRDLVGVPLDYQWIQPPEALRSGKALVGVPLAYEPMQFHSNVSSIHRPRSPPPHYYQQGQGPVGTWDAPWNQLLDIDFSIDNVRSHLNNIDQDLEQAFESMGMDRSKARRHSGSLVQVDWVENNVYNLKIPVYLNVEPNQIECEVDHGTLCIRYKNTERVREGEAVEEVCKKIPLPENVNAEKVRCIYKPQGYLFIEAPLKTGSAQVHLEKDTSRVSQFADKEKENVGQPHLGQSYIGYGPRRQFGTWADVVEKGRPGGPPRRRFGEFQDQLGQRDRRDLNLPIPPERAGLSPPRETSVYVHRTEKHWPSVDQTRERATYPYPQRREEHGPSMTEKAGEKLDQAKEKVEEGWDKTKQKVGEGYEKTKDTIGSGWEKAKDTVESGYEKTKDTLGEGWEKVKEGAETAKDKVAEGYEKTKEKVKEGAEKVKDTLTPSESHEERKPHYEYREHHQPQQYEYRREYQREYQPQYQQPHEYRREYHREYQPQYQQQPQHEYKREYQQPHTEEKPLTTRIGEVLEKPLDAYAEGMHKIQEAVTPSETEHELRPHFGEERKYGTFEGTRPQRWEEFDNKPPRNTEGIQRPLLPTGERHEKTHWEQHNLGRLHEDRPPYEQRFEQQHRYQQQPQPQVISPRSDVSEESLRRHRRSTSPEHEGKPLTEKIGEVLQKPLDAYAEGMHKIEDAVTPSVESHEKPHVVRTQERIPERPSPQREEHHKPEKESKGVLKTIGDKIGKAVEKVENVVMPKSDEKEKSPSKDTGPQHKERHEVHHEEWPRGEHKPPTIEHKEKHYVRHEQDIPSGPGPMEHKQMLHGQRPHEKQGLQGRPPIPEMTEHHTPYLEHPTERTDIRPEHRTIHREEHHETHQGQPLFLTGPREQQRGHEEKGIGEKIGEKAHEAKEKIKEGAETVKEKVQEGAEKVKEGAQKVAGKVQEGWEKTKEKASEGADKVKEKAEQGKEKVQQGWEKTKEKAEEGKDKLEEGWEKTKDKAQEGKEKIQEKAHEGKEKLKEGAEKAKEKAQQGAEKVKEKGHEGKEKLKEGAEKVKHKAQQGAENLQQKGHEGKQQVKGKLQEGPSPAVRRDIKEVHEVRGPGLHRQVEQLRKSPEKTGLPKPEKTGKSPLEKRESPEKESKPITEKIGETVGKAAQKVSQGYEAAKEKVKEAVTPEEKEHKKQVHKPEAHIKEKPSVLKPQTKHLGERVGEGVRKFEGTQVAQGTQQYETVPRPFVTVETTDEPTREHTKVTVDISQGQKRIDPKTAEYSKAAIDVTKGGIPKEKGKDFSPSAV